MLKMPGTAGRRPGAHAETRRCSYPLIFREYFQQSCDDHLSSGQIAYNLWNQQTCRRYFKRVLPRFHLIKY